MTDSYEVLTQTGFDLNIAVFLAKASQAAYSDIVSPEKWAADNGFTKIQEFNNKDTQGFWCTVDNTVALLAFRGTESPSNWVRDARIFPAPYPWGRVHIGFRDGVRAVEGALQEFETVAKNSKHVWITGHSLGGALALIAAGRLKMKGVSPYIYTYGQPRVGLNEFAERFNVELSGQLYRFINQSDIIT